MVPMITAIATAAMLSIGAWLLFSGLRGRVAKGVLECRRCKQATDPAAPSATCAECGADLARPRGVRPRRVRSRRRIAWGALLLAPVLAGFGAALVAKAANLDPWPMLPTRVLAFVIGHGPDAQADSATAEFERRLSAGALSEADAASTAIEAVRRMERADRAWNPAWDPLARMLRQRGLVPDASWGAFWDRGLKIDAVLPAKARGRSSVRLCAVIACRPAPFGLLPPNTAWLQLHEPEVRIGEVLATDAHAESVARRPLDGGPSTRYSSIELPQLPLGETEARVLFRYDILDGPAGSGKVLLSRTVERVLELTIVGDDETIVEVVRDQSAGEAFRSAIRVKKAKVRESSLGPGRMVELELACDHAPADGAFIVLVRARDGSATPVEEDMGPLSALKDSRNMIFIYGAPSDTIVPGRYDIVLRPSVKVAEEHGGLASVWMGDDIVIEDVEFVDGEPTSPTPSPSPEPAR